MPDEILCKDCGVPIEDPEGPEVVAGRRIVRPPVIRRLLEDEEEIAYFHSRCYHGQVGYERILGTDEL